jgi:hypothetical protein
VKRRRAFKYKKRLPLHITEGPRLRVVPLVVLARPNLRWTFCAVPFTPFFIFAACVKFPLRHYTVFFRYTCFIEKKKMSGGRKKEAWKKI